MHSLAMAQDILEAVLSEATKCNAKHIRAIGVKIGSEHADESDSIQFCLEAATKGTIAEGANVGLEVTDIKAKCPECGHVFTVTDHFPICPRCGNRNPEMLNDMESPQITLELD